MLLKLVGYHKRKHKYESAVEDCGVPQAQTKTLRIN